VKPTELQKRVLGSVISSAEPVYESTRTALLWNQVVPRRYPRLIAHVAHENDVVEAVKFARANRMKVAVRGGGHSWVGFPLRDDSLLIDLGHLNRVTIDRAARRAVVQPAIRSREFNRLLAAQGLAFPVGHCPTVPLGGFLLNGGLGWNLNTWGPGCFSIEAARVVTADGSVQEVNERTNPDLLWAVRGAGPGFFGVVTELSLRLYPAPRAITTSNYWYPLESVEEVGAWVAGVARELRQELELSIVTAAAHPAIADRCTASNGFACLVTGTAFMDDASEAVDALSLLDRCPVSRGCLLREPNLATPIDVLHDASGMTFPERHHYLADTLWTDSPPAEVLATSREQFQRAPSANSFELFFVSTGTGPTPLPEGAYSMWARALILCYAVWERPEDDTANAQWHRTTIAALDRYAVGHYVGESDIVTDPTRAERSYSKANWERLRALRRQYDPEGLFHGHFGSVTN
jgi:FAD/FMN-containing dehydrogenase